MQAITTQHNTTQHKTRQEWDPEAVIMSLSYLYHSLCNSSTTTSIDTRKFFSKDIKVCDITFNMLVCMNERIFFNLGTNRSDVDAVPAVELVVTGVRHSEVMCCRNPAFTT